MKFQYVGAASLILVLSACGQSHHNSAQSTHSSQKAAAEHVLPSTDERQAVRLNNMQRDHVLDQMRQMLGATQLVMEGLGESDLAKVEAGARPSGARATQTPEHQAEMQGLHVKKALPPEFRQMTKQVKQMFDDVADMAAAGESVSAIQGELANGLQTCNACHSIYQLPKP